MPHKKHTPQEIKEDIKNLTEQNLDKTKNVELDIRFQEFECKRIKLEEFTKNLTAEKVSTVQYLSNLDSCI